MKNIQDIVKLQSALVTVFDKTGLESLCRTLHERSVRLYATGGTAIALEEKFKLPVIRVESITQFPELMEGRVKTLHPKIFGGVLARRYVAKDLEEASAHGVPLFDAVIGNLYPFWEHLGKSQDDQSAFIDIGGPSLLRAASKNSVSVTVVSDPKDYTEFLEELQANNGSTTLAFRRRMAARTFQRTSDYDGMIAGEWAKEATSFPTQVTLVPQRALRYGENPHQPAAWCGTPDWTVLQGKELSYNNLLDAEAACALAFEYATPAVAIIKHNNPCGAAAGDRPLAQVFQEAFACDEKSAFGGIVALNRAVDGPTAEQMSAIFFEVILAPGFDAKAQEILSAKKNLRLISWKQPKQATLDIRRSLGGWLIQRADQRAIPQETRVVTLQTVNDQIMSDLRFAWLVCKHVKSNAIVIAKNGMTLGIGAGQMSRVDSVEIALREAEATGLQGGAVLASDAFFPFRDNIDLLKGKGISAIIQPGGSQRDQEVIDACNEHGIAMVFTGERHFRH